MPKAYEEYLKHILLECNWLENQFGENMKPEDFLNNETLKRAAARSLEIIGEASKKIPVDQKLKWSEIPWKNMAGMRDRLIHDYMGVNYLIVLDVIQNFIPDLKLKVEIILNRT